MELMLLDFSFLVISFISVSLIFAFCFLSLKYCDSNPDNAEDIAVIDIIRELKKTCPVGYDNRWERLPKNLSSIQCWSKNIPFFNLKNSIKLYGATCAVSCSSTHTFSLIPDVSKWGRWEPSLSAQNLTLQTFSSRDLKKDHFMQVNEITSLEKGPHDEPYITMYCFSSLSLRRNKWILFWNVKKFEFMFFLLQPRSFTGDDECEVTHIYGSDDFYRDFSTQVSERLRNLKEFLFLLQLNTRPLNHSFVTHASQSSEKKLAGSKDSPLEAENCDDSNSVLVFVPLYQYLCFGLKRLKGFNLRLKKFGMKSNLDTNIPNRDIAKSNCFDEENLKKTISENNDPTTKYIKESNLTLEETWYKVNFRHIKVKNRVTETINSN